MRFVRWLARPAPRGTAIDMILPWLGLMMILLLLVLDTGGQP